MNKFLASILFLSMCLLVSCGDDSLIRESEGELHQYVYGVPDRYAGNIVGNFAPLGNLYIEQGQTVRFYAGYSNGEQIYIDETLQQYYGGHSWIIGDEDYNLNTFRHTFNSAGEVVGSLETVDLYGDTLRNEFHIYVNTPNSIELTYPYDGYNQASPELNQQQPLYWTIHGIDPWETALCQVFASYYRDSVWDKPIGYVDCNSYALLTGSLLDSVAYHENKNVAQDSSFTLYWAIILQTQIETGKRERDSSSIFHFSTRILSDSSTIRIPIVYDRYRDNALLQTQVHLITAKGDTLKTLVNESPSGTVTAKVEAQTGLKIFIEEMFRKEYAPESTTIDISPYTVLELDTVRLGDAIPPQIAPFAPTISIKDSIAFLVYDDGSGINPSKLKVVVNRDTVESDFHTPMLLFKAKCTLACNVKIIGEDYARNPLPQVYWYIENKSNTYTISGPFASEEP